MKDRVIKLKDGRRLGYGEYGDEEGKPLFYFHGWPSSRLQADIYHEEGKKLHTRIISIDRPGYGLSEFKAKRTLLDWPDDVIELANQLKINKFSVMGVSGGGPYAAVCAYKIPHRLTTVGIVAGLAPPYVPGLLDGMYWFTKFGWNHYAAFPILGKLSSFFHYLNAHFGPSLGLHRFLFGAKEDRKIFSDPRIRELTRKNYREAFKNGFKGVEHDLQIYTTNWGFDFQNIQANVFLFYGADDRNVPIAMGRYYASHIPHSKLTLYPKEGHLISKTHGEEILRILSK